MKSCRANRLCHANCVTTRIGIPYSGSAPTKQSCTYTSCPCQKAIILEYSRSKCFSESGWLTSPQFTWGSVVSSSTTNLSLGDRPVYCPVRTTNDPPLARFPSLRWMACSTNCAVPRFQYATLRLRNPCSSRPCRLGRIPAFAICLCSVGIVYLFLSQPGCARIVELSHEPDSLGMCPRARVGVAGPRPGHRIRVEWPEVSNTYEVRRDYHVRHAAATPARLRHPPGGRFQRFEGPLHHSARGFHLRAPRRLGAARLRRARRGDVAGAERVCQRRHQTGPQLREFDLRESKTEIHQRLRAAPPERPSDGVGEAESRRRGQRPGPGPNQTDGRRIHRRRRFLPHRRQNARLRPPRRPHQYRHLQFHHGLARVS